MLGKLKFQQFAKLGRLKQLPQNKFFITIFITLLFIVGVVLYQNNSVFKNGSAKNVASSKFDILIRETPSPISTSTPKPLTFSEMSALYGPCLQLPVLMYHHVQTKDAAAADNQTTLTTDTDFFKSQMQYLKDRNYNVISMGDLIGFFDNGISIPKHSVLLTFDDAYQDFFTDAYPILRDLGFKATVFTPTGLVENPDYLTWNEISLMNGPVLFANHTWSHKNVGVSDSVMKYEISTADTQLSEHGLGIPKVFAYPYGFDDRQAENYLNLLGYKLAFTTKPGNILCKKQRLDLPRVRIGNRPLSLYGF